MDQIQQLAPPSSRAVTQFPRSSGLDYHSTNTFDRRQHRLVLRGKLNTWNTFYINFPDLDLLGNDGYLVAVEKVVLHCNRVGVPDSAGPGSFRQPETAEWQGHVNLQTLGLTSGRVIINDNFQSFDKRTWQRDPFSNNEVRLIDNPDFGAQMDGSYADWYMHREYDPKLLTSEAVYVPVSHKDFVVPHPRMQFNMQWKIEPREVRMPTFGLNYVVGEESYPWAEVTFVFYPNRYRTWH